MRDVWIMADTHGAEPMAPLLKVCPSPSGRPGEHADGDGNYLGTWFKVVQVPDDVPNGRVVALLFDAKPGPAHHILGYTALAMHAALGCPCCMH